MIQELFSRPILIFGCGNTLLGDDGFGPATIEHLLRKYEFPPEVFAVDIGTGIGDLLFDLALAPIKPTHIFIVDAISQVGRTPGEIFEIGIDEIPANKSGDFSLHQFPSVNMLQELRDLGGVQVRVLAVQVSCIPSEVAPGLSREVEAAIDPACRWLADQVSIVTACNLAEISASGSEAKL